MVMTVGGLLAHFFQLKTFHFRASSSCQWSYGTLYDVIHIRHTWKLRILKMFSVQYIINSVDVKQIYSGCSRSNISLQNIVSRSNTQHLYTFCGKHSKITVYAGPDSDVQVAHFHLVHTSVNISFTLVSVGILQSKDYPHTQPVYLTETLQVLALNMTLYTFVVHMQKYLRACVQVTNFGKHSSYSILLDGPGYLSEYLTANKATLNAGICGSSHQFLLQIFCVYSVSFFNINISLSTRNPDSSEVFIPYNSSSICMFSKRQPGDKTEFYLVRLYTHPDHHLNVTVRSVDYIGLETILCFYGGIAFFDMKNNTQTESALICSNKTLGSHWNIYSSEHTMLMVIYSYKHYSTIKTFFQISRTSCRKTRVNICKLLTMCQKDKRECIDLHVESGFKPKTYSFQDRKFDKLQLIYDVDDGKCAIFQIGNTVYHGKFSPTEIWQMGKKCNAFLHPALSSETKVFQHTVFGVVKKTGGERFDECVTFPGFHWRTNTKEIFHLSFNVTQPVVESIPNIVSRTNTLSENWLDITVKAKHYEHISGKDFLINQTSGKVPLRSMLHQSVFVLELGENELSQCYGSQNSDQLSIDLFLRIKYFWKFWKFKSNVILNCRDPIKFVALKNVYTTTEANINIISAIKYTKKSNGTVRAYWLPWIINSTVSNPIFIFILESKPGLTALLLQHTSPSHFSIDSTGQK